MKKFSVLVIEDDDSDFLHFKQLLEGYGKEEQIEFTIARRKNGASFKAEKNTGFDLAFFDIDLKDSNGIDLSKTLREEDKDVGIIFLTNLAQFAIKGYEVDALDFLVKPLSYFDFRLKMRKALSRIKNRDEEIIISNQNNFMAIKTSTIKYIEVRHHDIFFHTTTGIIKSYGSLKELESKLDHNLFVRCNNCFLVNLDYVTGVDGYDAIIGDERLLISHPKKKEFLRAVNDHYNGTL